LIIFREFIVIKLFGEQFRSAIIPFTILAIGFAINGLSIPYTLFFKAQQKGILVRNITFTSQLLYIILNVILIPVYGIIGSAWAGTIAFAVDFILYIIYYKKTFTA
jgi:O-antigen/teichoic acid export membrane protein